MVQAHQSHNRSVQVHGDLPADPVHGETPPPCTGGKKLFLCHLYQAKIKRRDEEKGSETRVQMKGPNCFRVLHTTSTLELHISIPAVD